MSEYRELVHGSNVDYDFLKAANSFGLYVPSVYVSEVLENRLARRGEVLVVDEEMLARGTEDLEIERPLSIKIDAISKDSKSVNPELSFPGGDFDSSTEVKVRIQPNLSADAVKKGGYDRLNAGFWLGTVIANRMAEGTTAQDLSRKPSQGKAHQVAIANVAVVATGAIAGDGMIYAFHRPEGFLLLLGTTIGGNLWNHRTYKNFKMDSADYLQMKYQKAGEELAEKYPALSFDMLPS